MKPQIDIRKTAFEMGEFRVEPMRNLVRKGTKSYSLEPRIMEVLCELAAHHGHVVTREDFISRLWNVEYGADESLTRAISLLRKTFRKGGAAEKYIETIPKRGYRLTQNAAISVLTQVATPNLAPRAQEPQHLAPSIHSLAPSEIVSPQHASEKARAVVIPMPSRRSIWALLLIPMVLIMGGLNLYQLREASSLRGSAGTYDASVTPSIPVPPAVDVLEIDNGQSFGQLLATTRPFGRSVAVMPFIDMSAKKDQEYFTDGMVEELLGQLANIPDLKIIGRSATLAYEGKKMDSVKLGENLNVSHIINGSVRKQGNRVRISTQLINTEDNAHVWSNTYNGTLDNVFELQEKISREIVSELTLVLSIGFENVIELDLDTIRK